MASPSHHQRRLPRPFAGERRAPALSTHRFIAVVGADLGPAMEQYGNLSTFNMETVLKQNIVAADFYRGECARLTTWQEVIDQIYYQVDYVEPWLAGNARGPSTAFCLLFRLFHVKPSEEELRATIDHEDSVYIRAVCIWQDVCALGHHVPAASHLASHQQQKPSLIITPSSPHRLRHTTRATCTHTVQIGFLYLRYVCDPRTLWSWLGPYCGDDEVRAFAAVSPPTHSTWIDFPRKKAAHLLPSPAVASNRHCYMRAAHPAQWPQRPHSDSWRLCA